MRKLIHGRFILDVQNGTIIVNVRDLDHETGWSVPRLSIRDPRYSDEFRNDMTDSIDLKLRFTISIFDTYRLSLMRDELLPETPKLYCLNQLLDQHYFNRQLIWEEPPKAWAVRKESTIGLKI